MFMYVCGHMYPSVCFHRMPKKSGTMDMTPSAKSTEGKKEMGMIMSQRRKRTKELKHTAEVTKPKKKKKKLK